VAWAWIEVQACVISVEALRKKLSPELDVLIRQVLVVGSGSSSLTLARQMELFGD
jgi:ribulose 1,5-bisphosphate synthetase/thiazole synthase